MEKRMESLDQFDDVLKLIDQYETIAIFHHIRPDGDCLGSSQGLREILADNFPKKRVVVIGDHADRFPWLDMEFTDEKDVDMSKTLSIIVDVSGKDRVEKFSVAEQSDHMVRIDHHPNISDYATTTVLMVDRPATCQIVTELALRAKWKISAKAATFLYLGLLTDSGRFLYRSVTEETYVCAADLTRFGADRDFVHTNLYKRSLTDIAFEAEICSNMKFDKDKKVVYFYTSEEMINRYGMKPDDCARPNIMGGIEGVRAWVLFTQYPEYIRVEFRCIAGYKINEVAFKFNGGGHDQASGCKIMTEAEIKDVISEVSKLVA